MAKFFYKYDIHLIVLFAIINIIIFALAKTKLYRNHRAMNPIGSKRFQIKADITTSPEEARSLQKERNLLLMLYSLYANITAIFPLLGIIGTVASLITVSKDANMMDNLMVALNTTLWGVFFAIIFKFIDSLISGPIEAFVDDADYTIRKFDQREDS